MGVYTFINQNSNVVKLLKDNWQCIAYTYRPTNHNKAVYKACSCSLMLCCGLLGDSDSMGTMIYYIFSQITSSFPCTGKINNPLKASYILSVSDLNWRGNKKIITIHNRAQILTAAHEATTHSAFSTARCKQKLNPSQSSFVCNMLSALGVRRTCSDALH
jgi:hypothetical protein